MLQNFIGDFHATPGHEGKHTGCEGVQCPTMTQSLQTQQISGPSCELMRGGARWFVNENETRGKALLKRAVVGSRSESGVRCGGIVQDMQTHSIASNKATTCSSI